jgi:HEAT repeat protein
MKKARPQDARTAWDPAADVADRASALSRLTSDRRLDLVPKIARLMEDPEPMLRSEAVMTLVGRWRLDEYVDAAIDRLRCDADPAVRRDAAAALSIYTERTGRRREQILRELTQCVSDDYDLVTRRRCYEDLLRILAPGRVWLDLPANFDVTTDVDWSLLRPYV